MGKIVEVDARLDTSSVSSALEALDAKIAKIKTSISEIEQRRASAATEAKSGTAADAILDETLGLFKNVDVSGFSGQIAKLSEGIPDAMSKHVGRLVSLVTKQLESSLGTLSGAASSRQEKEIMSAVKKAKTGLAEAMASVSDIVEGLDLLEWSGNGKHQTEKLKSFASIVSDFHKRYDGSKFRPSLASLSNPESTAVSAILSANAGKNAIANMPTFIKAAVLLSTAGRGTNDHFNKVKSNLEKYGIEKIGEQNLTNEDIHLKYAKQIKSGKLQNEKYNKQAFSGDISVITELFKRNPIARRFAIEAGHAAYSNSNEFFYDKNAITVGFLQRLLGGGILTVRKGLSGFASSQETDNEAPSVAEQENVRGSMIQGKKAPEERPKKQLTVKGALKERSKKSKKRDKIDIAENIDTNSGYDIIRTINDVGITAPSSFASGRPKTAGQIVKSGNFERIQTSFRSPYTMFEIPMVVPEQLGMFRGEGWQNALNRLRNIGFEEKTTGHNSQSGYIAIGRSEMTDLLGMHGDKTFGDGQREIRNAPSFFELDTYGRFQKYEKGELVPDEEKIAAFRSENFRVDKKTGREVMDVFGSSYFAYTDKNGKMIMVRKDKAGILPETDQDIVFETTKDRDKAIEARTKRMTPSVPIEEFGGRTPDARNIGKVALKPFTGQDGVGWLSSQGVFAEDFQARGGDLKGTLQNFNFPDAVKELYGTGEFYVPANQTAVGLLRKANQENKTVKSLVSEGILTQEEFDDLFTNIADEKMELLIDETIDKNPTAKDYEDPSVGGDGRKSKKKIVVGNSAYRGLYAKNMALSGGLRIAKSSGELHSEKRFLSEQASSLVKFTPEEIEENIAAVNEYIDELYTVEGLQKYLVGKNTVLGQALEDDPTLALTSNEIRKRVDNEIEAVRGRVLRGQHFSQSGVKMDHAKADPFAVLANEELAKANGISEEARRNVEEMTLKEGDVATNSFGDEALTGGRHPSALGEVLSLINQKKYLDAVKKFGGTESGVYINQKTLDKMGGGDYDGDTVYLLNDVVATAAERMAQRLIEVHDGNPKDEVDRDVVGNKLLDKKGFFTEDIIRQTVNRSAGVANMAEDSAKGLLAAEIGANDRRDRELSRKALQGAADYTEDSVQHKTGTRAKHSYRGLETKDPSHASIYLKKSMEEETPSISDAGFSSIYDNGTYASVLMFSGSAQAPGTMLTGITDTLIGDKAKIAKTDYSKLGVLGEVTKALDEYDADANALKYLSRFMAVSNEDIEELHTRLALVRDKAAKVSAAKNGTSEMTQLNTRIRTREDQLSLAEKYGHTEKNVVAGLGYAAVNGATRRVQYTDYFKGKNEAYAPSAEIEKTLLNAMVNAEEGRKNEELTSSINNLRDMQQKADEKHAEEIKLNGLTLDKIIEEAKALEPVFGHNRAKAIHFSDVVALHSDPGAFYDRMIAQTPNIGTSFEASMGNVAHAMAEAVIKRSINIQQRKTNKKGKRVKEYSEKELDSLRKKLIKSEFGETLSGESAETVKTSSKHAIANVDEIKKQGYVFVSAEMPLAGRTKSGLAIAGTTDTVAYKDGDFFVFDHKPKASNAKMPDEGIFYASMLMQNKADLIKKLKEANPTLELPENLAETAKFFVATTPYNRGEAGPTNFHFVTDSEIKRVHDDVERAEIASRAGKYASKIGGTEEEKKDIFTDVTQKTISELELEDREFDEMTETRRNIEAIVEAQKVASKKNDSEGIASAFTNAMFAKGIMENLNKAGESMYQKRRGYDQQIFGGNFWTAMDYQVGAATNQALASHWVSDSDRAEILNKQKDLQRMILLTAMEASEKEYDIGQYELEELKLRQNADPGVVARTKAFESIKAKRMEHNQSLEYLQARKSELLKDIRAKEEVLQDLNPAQAAEEKNIKLGETARKEQEELSGIEERIKEAIEKKKGYEALYDATIGEIAAGFTKDEKKEMKRAAISAGLDKETHFDASRTKEETYKEYLRAKINTLSDAIKKSKDGNTPLSERLDPVVQAEYEKILTEARGQLARAEGRVSDSLYADFLNKSELRHNRTMRHAMRNANRPLANGNGFIARMVARAENVQIGLEDQLEYLISGRDKTQAEVGAMETAGVSGDDKNFVRVKKRLEEYNRAIEATEFSLKKFNGANKALVGSMFTVSDAIGSTVQKLSRQFFQRALSEARRFVKQFDAQMNEIQTITMKTGDEMMEVKTSTLKTAKDLRMNVSDVAAVKADLYRQGLSDKEMDDRLETILKFSKVAKLRPADATKIVTTALQNNMVKNAKQAADSFAALGDSAATTAAEIQLGYQKSAASAKAAGVNHDELSALLTMGIAKTQLSGRTVGTAYQTLFSRMGSLTKEKYAEELNGEGIAWNDSEAALNYMGVSMKDERGNMRERYDVLRDIGMKWGTATDAQKQLVTTALAGTRQANIFQTLMQGISEDGGETLDEYLNKSKNSAGTVDDKFAIAAESMAAHMDELNTSFDTLIANFVNGGTVSFLFDIITGVLDGFSSVEGSLGGITTAAAAVISAFAGMTVAARLHSVSQGMSGIAGAATAALGPIAGILLGVGSFALTGLVSNMISGNSKEKSEATVRKSSRQETAKFAQRFMDDATSKKYEAEKEVSELNKLADAYQNATDAEKKVLSEDFEKRVERIKYLLPDAANGISNVSASIDNWKTKQSEFNEVIDKTIAGFGKLSRIEAMKNLFDGDESEGAFNSFFNTQRNSNFYASAKIKRSESFNERQIRIMGGKVLEKVSDEDFWRNYDTLQMLPALNEVGESIAYKDDPFEYFKIAAYNKELRKGSNSRFYSPTNSQRAGEEKLTNVLEMFKEDVEKTYGSTEDFWKLLSDIQNKKVDTAKANIAKADLEKWAKRYDVAIGLQTSDELEVKKKQTAKTIAESMSYNDFGEDADVAKKIVEDYVSDLLEKSKNSKLSSEEIQTEIQNTLYNAIKDGLLDRQNGRFVKEEGKAYRTYNLKDKNGNIVYSTDSYEEMDEEAKARGASSDMIVGTDMQNNFQSRYDTLRTNYAAATQSDKTDKRFYDRLMKAGSIDDIIGIINETPYSADKIGATENGNAFINALTKLGKLSKDSLGGVAAVSLGMRQKSAVGAKGLYELILKGDGSLSAETIKAIQDDSALKKIYETVLAPVLGDDYVKIVEGAYSGELPEELAKRTNRIVRSAVTQEQTSNPRAMNMFNSLISAEESGDAAVQSLLYASGITAQNAKKAAAKTNRSNTDNQILAQFLNIDAETVAGLSGNDLLTLVDKKKEELREGVEAYINGLIGDPTKEFSFDSDMAEIKTMLKEKGYAWILRFLDVFDSGENDVSTETKAKNEAIGNYEESHRAESYAYKKLAGIEVTNQEAVAFWKSDPTNAPYDELFAGMGGEGQNSARNDFLRYRAYGDQDALARASAAYVNQQPFSIEGAMQNITSDSASRQMYNTIAEYSPYAKELMNALTTGQESFYVEGQEKAIGTMQAFAEATEAARVAGEGMFASGEKVSEFMKAIASGGDVAAQQTIKLDNSLNSIRERIYAIEKYEAKTDSKKDRGVLEALEYSEKTLRDAKGDEREKIIRNMKKAIKAQELEEGRARVQVANSQMNVLAKTNGLAGENGEFDAKKLTERLKNSGFDEVAKATAEYLKSNNKETVELSDLVDIKTGNLTGFGESVKGEIGSILTGVSAIIQSFSGSGIELVNEGLKLVFKSLGGKAPRGGGGGGGGGKSEAQKFLEQLKHESKLYEHQHKMLQYQAQRYQSRGELTNYGRIIEEEQAMYRKRLYVLVDNQRRIKDKMATVAVGSDDWHALRDALFEAMQQYEETTNAIEENTRKLKENQQAILKTRTDLENTIKEEIENRKSAEKDRLSGSVSMQQTILEAIKKRYEDEWALQKKDIEKKKEALNEEKNLINERLNARKEAQNEEEKYKELAEYRRQLASVSLDSTRTKDAAELRDKIDKLEKEIGWDIAEDEAKVQQKEIDNQLSAYERIEKEKEEDLQALLENANNFTAEINKVMKMNQKDMYDWMKTNVQEYANSFAAAQQQMVDEWNDTYKQMYGIVDTYWKRINAILGDKNRYMEFLKQSSEFIHASHSEQQQMIYEWGKAYDDWIKANKGGGRYDHDDVRTNNEPNYINGNAANNISVKPIKIGNIPNLTNVPSVYGWEDAAKIAVKQIVGVRSVLSDEKLLKSLTDAANEMSKIKIGNIWTNVDTKSYKPDQGDGMKIERLEIVLNEAKLEDDADYEYVARKVGESFVKELSKQGVYVNNFSL